MTLWQDGSHKESHKSSSSSKKRRESSTPKCVEIKKQEEPSESEGEDDGALTLRHMFIATFSHPFPLSSLSLQPTSGSVVTGKILSSSFLLFPTPLFAVLFSLCSVHLTCCIRCKKWRKLPPAAEMPPKDKKFGF